VLRTESAPRWLAILGYVFAALLLISITYVEWIALLFPLWILMLSVHILVENYRRDNQA
jgi:type IV secretory pathway TrbD component